MLDPKVDDLFFYPQHGVVRVIGFETRFFNDKKTNFVKLEPINNENLSRANVDIQVIVENMESIGIRRLTSKNKINEVLKIFGDDSELKQTKDTQWSQIHKENTEALNTGDIKLIASVINTLSLKATKKKQSTSDKRILSYARYFLIGEIAGARKISFKKAEEQLDDLIEKTIGMIPKWQDFEYHDTKTKFDGQEDKRQSE